MPPPSLGTVGCGGSGAEDGGTEAGAAGGEGDGCAPLQGQT